MPTKLKKTKSAGRFGARYGKRVRTKLIKVETKQRVKQKCPFCEKLGTKRLSKGIWKYDNIEKKSKNIPTIQDPSKMRQSESIISIFETADNTSQFSFT